MARRNQSGGRRGRGGGQGVRQAGRRDPREQGESAIVIGGPHAVEAALTSEAGVRRVLVEQTAGARGDRIVALARELGVGISIVGRGDAEKASGVRAQGVAAELDYRYRDLAEILESKADLIVLLDGIEDPHNFGAILRSAEAAGVDAVVVPGRRSVGVTPTVVRTSAGAAVRVPVCKAGNLVQAVDAAREAGFWVIGLAADEEGADSGGARSQAGRLITPAKPGERVALVVGSEQAGIRRLVAEHCDELAALPMLGEIESLNASVAAALAMYRLREGKLYGR